jgi:hypothetical protein
MASPDPAKPYEGFGDSTSRAVHSRERIEYLIQTYTAELQETSLRDRFYSTGRIDGLKQALQVMEGK